MDNESGSRIIFRDKSKDQQYHASSDSTSTPGGADGVTRGCPPMSTNGPMLMLLTAVREQERKQETPSNVLDLSCAGGDLEAQGQRTVTGRPAEMSPQHLSQGDRMGRDTHDAAQSEEFKSECR